MGSATRRRCRQQENTPVRLFLPIDAGSSKAWSAAVLPSISDICCEVPELRGDNFKIWKERILLRLGCMDINYAIRKDEPHKITDTSTPNEILLYERWEKSNHLSVMYIKTKISAGIRDSIEQHENVRELLKAIDEQFVTSDKALASTLIMKFTSLKLTGIRGVHEHIMEMRDIVAQLKKLEELPGTSEQQVEPHTSLEDIGATLRRSTRTKRSAIPNDYVVYLQECDYNIRVENDPESFSQAMSCKELELWYNDMKDEMSSMKCNNVWDLVELPNGAKVIGCKWVFKTKKDSLGNIERHKAKLVAKGFT
ncbi:hypothetical protein VitviT2T_003743 [Vitis vinifera]|uniref:Reverse transcriptase Ty1/copia-type domain-containing protein n=1 Tax=Vitis vinifera TaxID=29760 RepID=A0ABY9BNF4_VITVI|nr:hypothetical protein VitviT2T_003743 [Vitis vinifera]